MLAYGGPRVTRTSTFLIVGASLAGLSAAETLRKDGYDGHVVMVGDEPTPPMTGRPCPNRSSEVNGNRPGRSSETKPTTKASSSSGG